MAKRANATATSEKKKPVRVSQSDVPAFQLSKALAVSQAIFDHLGGAPSKPFSVANAMELTPTSSQFRMITGASIAYGLTEGGYNAPEISLTPLSRKILSPTEDGAEYAAQIEAFLRPRVISEFLKRYDASPWPREDIAVNVLVEMGVPRERASQVRDLIFEDAKTLGLISEIKGKKFVNVSAIPSKTISTPPDLSKEDDSQDIVMGTSDPEPQKTVNISAVEHSARMKRVFITHGKNKEFVEPIKKLLSFGEMEAVVSVERQSVSQPVPDKVMNDMRMCGAAIIHVSGEQILLDKEAREHLVLNPNVLIEIGAAMALYGRRFILLVKSGVKLPSNLQGLYEVRYDGESLNGDSTIRLLEAIKQLKETPLV